MFSVQKGSIDYLLTVLYLALFPQSVLKITVFVLFHHCIVPHDIDVRLLIQQSTIDGHVCPFQGGQVH